MQLLAYVEALDDAEAALRLDPGFAKALFRKALALEGLQQKESALTVMIQAQKLQPQDAQIQKAVARLRHVMYTSLNQPDSQQKAAVVATEAPEDVQSKKHIKLQPGWLYHPSPDGVDENLLILLHGYGDRPEPYAKLARQMALPQTACLALPGPIGPVLGTPTGRAWYNEEDEDNGLTVSGHGTDSIGSTLTWLMQVLRQLHDDSGWRSSHTHLFGFSQGGSAALHLALHCRGVSKLGSCVAVAAALLPQQLTELRQHQQQSTAGHATPLLITRGSRDTEVPSSRAEATVAAARQAGSLVRFHSIPGKAHGMVDGPSEMRLLMAFWAESLKHRPVQAGTEGSPQASFVEIHGGRDMLSSLQMQC